MWWEVILDALYDTLKLLPFLLLLYILIELMEHNTRVGKPLKALSGKAAPLVGTATGLVPMCGFSVMAAKLYEHRHVTLGALLAVFISTSDEAFIVLLLSNMAWADKGISIAAFVGVKLVLGIAIGYLTDLVCSRKESLAPMPAASGHMHGHENDLINAPECADEHIHAGTIGEHDHGHDYVHDHEHDYVHDHGHDHEHEEDHEHGHCECDELTVCEHKKEGTLRLYLLSPLLHALQVAAFVLLVNLVFGYVFWGVGEENVAHFLMADGVFWVQPLLCALIGLVPNCASSVVLAEAFAVGGISFGSCLAGLIVNAGLAYLVLFRRREHLKRAIYITLFMVALGIAVGYAANAIDYAFFL